MSLEDTIQPTRGNKDGKHKEVYRHCRGTSTEERAWIFWKICFSQVGNTNRPPTHSAGKLSVDQEARCVEENCFLNNRRSKLSPLISTMYRTQSTSPHLILQHLKTLQVRKVHWHLQMIKQFAQDETTGKFQAWNVNPALRDSRAWEPMRVTTGKPHHSCWELYTHKELRLL